MCTGYKDFWSLWCVLNFYDIKLNTLCRLEMLSFHLFVLCKDCICFSKIHTDILANITLYDTCYDILLFLEILIKYCLALFFSDLLKNQVLCILCCNTSEFLGMKLNLCDISDMKCRIDLLCILKTDLDCRIKYFFNNFSLCVYRVVTCVAVHNDLNIIGCSEMVLTCT